MEAIWYWERLVQSIKKVFRVILYNRSLRDDVILNLMLKAEYTVSCQPLTHVSLYNYNNSLPPGIG